MTELLTLTPWPDGETLVEALGGAGGGIKEPSPTELGAGGAGGGTLEPSPTELGAGGAGAASVLPLLESRLAVRSPRSYREGDFQQSYDEGGAESTHHPRHQTWRVRPEYLSIIQRYLIN